MNQRFSITPARAAADKDLSDSEHRTLAVIGMFGDPEGWCWPSQSTLADLRGISRKTINLHIKRLIELGYLNIYPRYDKETGAQKSNMMQIKLDFPPDVTGGVTSKTLQGDHILEVTPPNPQDVTHNDPVNDPVNSSSTRSAVMTAYEQTFGLVSSTIQAQKVYDDVDEFGETAVIEALQAARASGARSYGWVSARLNGRKADAAKKDTASDLWDNEIERYMNRLKKWQELTPKAQQVIRKIGGQSRLRSVKEGFELEQLRREVMSHV